MPTRYSATDGPGLAQVARRALKKPNPVYLLSSPEEFEVATNEGVLSGKPGDFIAYDPLSGHVWPVAASYVEMHYDWMDA